MSALSPCFLMHQSAPAAAPKDESRKFNNRDFIQFLQVRSQKSDRWDNITKEELAWYDSFPVLVVPSSQHPTLPVTLPGDGWIRGYGPTDASSTTNSNSRTFCSNDYDVLSRSIEIMLYSENHVLYYIILYCMMGFDMNPVNEFLIPILSVPCPRFTK